MEWERIRKRQGDSTDANLSDYETAVRSFSWPQARAMLEGLPNGGLNIAHEAVDRHAQGPLATHRALRWIGKDGARRDCC